MPRPPPKTAPAKRLPLTTTVFPEVMGHANRRAELLYYKLSDTCEGEPLAVVALAAIGLLVNTTRGREAIDQASAKRVVLAWLMRLLRTPGPSTPSRTRSDAAKGAPANRLNSDLSTQGAQEWPVLVRSKRPLETAIQANDAVEVAFRDETRSSVFCPIPRFERS
jgi:hypothetical protein